MRTVLSPRINAMVYYCHVCDRVALFGGTHDGCGGWLDGPYHVQQEPMVWSSKQSAEAAVSVDAIREHIMYKIGRRDAANMKWAASDA